ncbi:tautomerase family protein [Gilliamella sp. Pas-s25]|nr:tautomerase family protein [Gilliamella sp. Pas-s25]MWP62997.1 hypothetical protein [Gilliamella sp. Pas-s25]
MPLIDIYYTNNNFESKRKIIADTVYSSLREILNVKEGAKFIYFHYFKSGDCITPEQLWDISYSNNFIFIKITMNKGRTQQSKLQLYYKIAEQISQQLDISIDDVAICLIENEPVNWSFGGGKMQFVA